MIKPTLAVFAIVAIAAMMGAATVAPAFAGNSKTTFDTGGDFKIFEIFGCGVIVDVDGESKGSITTWDNGKMQIKTNTKLTLIDRETREIVGKGVSTSSFNISSKELPQTLQENTNINCINGESNEKVHTGFTVHKDGISMTFHGMS